MAFTVLTGVASLFILVGCPHNTHSKDYVRPVHDIHRHHSTQTSVTTSNNVTTASSHVMETPVNDSSHNVTDEGDTRGDEMVKNATDSPHSVDVNHKLSEEKEKQLLGGTEQNMKYVNEIVKEYVHDSVHKFVTAKGKITKAVVEKGSYSPSINALYELYSLTAYVSDTSEGKTKYRRKRSSNVQLDILYSLYSLVAYVAEDDNIDRFNASSREKSEEKTLEGGHSSPLHQANQTHGGADKTPSDSSKWSSYVVIALVVVAAASLLLVVAICMIRYCRRAKVGYGVASCTAVRGVGSPAT